MRMFASLTSLVITLAALAVIMLASRASLVIRGFILHQ